MKSTLRALIAHSRQRARSPWFGALAVVALCLASWSGWHRAGQAASKSANSPLATNDNELWQDIERSRLDISASSGIPTQARALRLNQAALARVLQQAPPEFTGKPRPTLSLPLPDGRLANFQIEASSSLEPALAARFPEINSYRGFSTDVPGLTLRCDLSPRGFYAFMLAGGALLTVQPAGDGNYVSFSAGQMEGGEIECLVRDMHEIAPGDSRALAPQVAVGPTMRNYRIAIAATWEYCNQYGSGTNAGTVASLNTWLNAANLVYERELTVHLNLVNDLDVLYTTERGFTSTTDPYDNANVGTMLDVVRSNLRDNVGIANYDIGHVFGQIAGTGGSGVAYVGVVCSNFDLNGLGALKGGGATRVGGTAANATALGVWVHELGHQFGSSHNFNGSLSGCASPNRSVASSYESGSGSTIMGYSGICGADNITNTRDMRFHSTSYAAITSYIASSATCKTDTATGNNSPTVNGGTDYTIPRQTPFTLTATGSDPDAGDAANLTYTWEQADAGGSLYPQDGTAASYNDAADPTSTTRPIFRPFAPSSSPSRTFPSLTYILNNANDPPDTSGGFQTAEELPRVGRTLNFRVMIRDNRAGGGGVNEDAVILTVAPTAGPFLVTAPNTAVSWTGNTQQTVTWSVNNTNTAPINAANVKISLSTDGGNTFPTVLLASTANDGSETLTVPNGINTTTARVKVEAVGNIFFDISDVNFTIVAGSGCPTITVNPTSLPGGTTSTAYNQQLSQTGGAGAIAWSSTGTLPPGVTLGSSTGLLSGTPTQTGTFNFTITATDANNCTGSRALSIVISCGTLTVNPTSLTNGTAGTAYNQAFSQTGGNGAINWSSTGTLPPGLTLTTGSGLFSGTPTQAGTFNFTIIATDANGCTGNRAYALTIACPTVTVNPTSLPGGTVGTGYNQIISATPAGTTYSFAVTSGTLPNGLSLNAGGTLSGTPTASGTFNFRITATGFGSCTGFRDYTVTIVCPTITVNPTTLPNGQIGQAYNQTVSATGSTGSPTFSFTGVLPTNLTLNPTSGLLSGTPTASGSFNFTVIATYPNGCTGSRSYTLVIGSCPAISITPGTLTAGRVGTAYSQTLTASGGTPNYNFTVNTGSTLPGGLTLSGAGLLSGNPNTAGSFTFTIRVTDANSCVGLQAFTLTIDPPCTYTLTPPTASFVGSGGSGSVTVTTLTGCAWTAASNAGWLTITGGASGTGSGSVTYNVAVNTGATRTGTITVNGQTHTVTQTGGLVYYPLAKPIRLFDTRATIPGFPACAFLNQAIPADSELVRGARLTCDGVTIPTTAQAIVGNATVTGTTGPGFLTLYPNGQTRPPISTVNYGTGETVQNAFTVALDANGDFKAYSFAGTHLIVDVTGYFAPPASGGLFYHPLPKPIRLFDTRATIPGFPACAFLNQAIAAGGELTRSARLTCDGVTIPNDALAIEGNATVTSTTGVGFITLYPNGQTRPPVANLNYNAGQTTANAFTVGLDGTGQFKAYAFAGTHLIVDVVGYYSASATDVNGAGLLYNPLARPLRLFDTRAAIPGFPACEALNQPLLADSEIVRQGRITCDGLTIPSTAAALVGNGAVTGPTGVGFLTLYPNGQTRPPVATLNYSTGQTVANALTVGLSASGQFRVYAFTGTHFIMDVSGFFAP